MDVKIGNRKFTFEEFRVIAQSKKAISDPMYRKFIVRKISIFLTMIFLRLKISANTITVLSMLCGVLAFLCFIISNYIGFLLALIFMQLWYLFDTSDGEVARYHRYIDNAEDKLSLSGLFFDNINHHLVHMLIIFGFSIAIFKLDPDLKVIIAGFFLMTSVLFVRLVSDCKSTAFLSRITKKKSFQVLTNAYTIPSSNTGLKVWIFSRAYSLFLFPKMLNIFSILIILLLVSNLKNAKIMALIIIAYAILGTALMFIKIYRVINSKRTEEEYNKRFKEIE
ncbi:MAG: CDP-alcohol phosphatidyltransferase family protein [Candidatus Omnitrophica bacterium]|nr:CDP-alcohol phosphatidyltransferase family protein [Candidatus Omnitrophota bacterium]